MSDGSCIVWAGYPEFQLVSNGGNWNKFCCVKSGEVILNSYLVSFPEGWETDFTSSPMWARSFVSQLGAHAPAVLIHDKLLDDGCPRAVARYWLDAQLRGLSLVSNAKRRRIVAAVWMYDSGLGVASRIFGR